VLKLRRYDKVKLSKTALQGNTDHGSSSRRPSTLVEVNAMTRKGAKVEIEVTAVLKK